MQSVKASEVGITGGEGEGEGRRVQRQPAVLDGEAGVFQRVSDLDPAREDPAVDLVERRERPLVDDRASIQASIPDGPPRRGVDDVQAEALGVGEDVVFPAALDGPGAVRPDL